MRPSETRKRRAAQALAAIIALALAGGTIAIIADTIRIIRRASE